MRWLYVFTLPSEKWLQAHLARIIDAYSLSHTKNKTQMYYCDVIHLVAAPAPPIHLPVGIMVT